MESFYNSPSGHLFLRAVMLDLYALLEIDTTSNATSVEKAFRTKASKWHPDKNPNNPEAKEMFEKLSDAKNVLIDPFLRAKYDMYWKTQFRFFKCGNCEKRFGSDADLKEHLKIHEEKTQDYEPKEKKKKKNVTFNMSYKCTTCGKTFTNKEAIEAHEKMIHIEEKPFKCQLCKQSFT